MHWEPLVIVEEQYSHLVYPNMYAKNNKPVKFDSIV